MDNITIETTINKLENIRLIKLKGNNGNVGNVVITKDPLTNILPDMRKYNSKPTEIMYFDTELKNKLFKILPAKEVSGVEGGYSVRGDIFVANTIPSPDIEIIREIKEGYSKEYQSTIKGRIFLVEPEIIIEMCKIIRGDDFDDRTAIIPIGYIELTVILLDGHTTTARILLQMDSDLIFVGSPTIIQLPKNTYELTDETLLTEMLYELYDLKNEIFITWYGTQLALLNPVLEARFKRETVPYADDKKKGTKGKKTPKKYVKKITLGDISDLEFAPEKKPHQIKEPLWWVSGHWRNQKTKEGYKRIFIQGYWKGILRNGPKNNTESRERELVLDNKTNNFYY